MGLKERMVGKEGGGSGGGRGWLDMGGSLSRVQVMCMCVCSAD